MTQYKKIIFTCCAVMFVMLIAIVLFCYAMMQKSEYDSEQNVRHWTNIQYGLWESDKTGELAIRVVERVGDKGSYEDMHDYKFITHLGVQGDGSDPKIKDVIDEWSFRQTSRQIYQDKNNVYYHRSHSDGGFLYETGMDTNSFKRVGQCYAQDKDYIYYISGSSGVGAMDVDRKTFKTCFGCGCVAKDKNSTYLFGDKVDLKDFTDAEITSLFSSLEHL